MPIHDRPELRDRHHVFRDRSHAGAVVAGMLEALRGSDACLLAIPAGGVPVAAAMSRALGLRLGVAVVSKITPPWNSEVGYGAVAFDGSVRLNDELVSRLGLSDRDVREGIEATLEKVRRRVPALRGSVDPSELAGHLVVLVDDGLASGFTMRAAVEAVRGCGSERVVIATPTGSARAAQALAPQVEDLFCANVRGGWRFAVAEAYEEWTDVDEAQAAAILAQARLSHQAS